MIVCVVELCNCCGRMPRQKWPDVPHVCGVHGRTFVSGEVGALLGSKGFVSVFVYALNTLSLDSAKQIILQDYSPHVRRDPCRLWESA